jgi:hypothetical protein
VQHEVARLVSVGVVETLEVVDVNHGQHQRLTTALAAQQLAQQALSQQAAVLAAGQAVAHGLLLRGDAQAEVG